jgi:NADH-quinone oxidoreductase subunit H
MIILLIIKLNIIITLSIFDLDWFKYLPIILPIILSIAFLTLYERKVLSAMQRRRGPNVTGLYGLLQAFADGVKLILKETIIPSSSNYIIFLLSPILIFTLSLFGWVVIPFSNNIVISDIDLGLIMLLAISSISVYGIIMSGWSSNSKYALLGALRSSAQMISYEVSMSLLLMPVILLSGTVNLTGIVYAQKSMYNCFPFFISFILFFICVLAETNRLPFDPPEAESELVSGYNVEYSSLTFAFFFLAEYSYIILMSSLIVILFLGGWIPIINHYLLNFVPLWFWFFIKLIFIIYSFIWVRATFPRYRYDQLMNLGWKVILPLSLASLFISIFLLLIFINI